MVNAHDVYGVLQVSHDIQDRSFRRVFAKKPVIECGMGDTALGSKCTHLVIGEVTGHIAERPAVAVRAYDGRTADVEGIVERFLGGMAQVDHDTLIVHPLDHFLPKLRHTVVHRGPPVGVADIVVAIVAERDIDDTTLREMAHVGEVMVQRQSILNTEHDRFAAFALVLIEVCRGTGNATICSSLSKIRSAYWVGEREGCRVSDAGSFVSVAKS